MLQSIEAYNTYGIQPSKLQFMIHNLFYFPVEYNDCLINYHLDIETTQSFLASIKEGRYEWWYSHDKEDKVSYQVIYHNTDPTRLLRRQEHTSVKLSFRVAQPEFNIAPTVLVKAIRT